MTRISIARIGAAAMTLLDIPASWLIMTVVQNDF
jgi:hypothetical protein